MVLHSFDHFAQHPLDVLGLVGRLPILIFILISILNLLKNKRSQSRKRYERHDEKKVRKQTPNPSDVFPFWVRLFTLFQRHGHLSVRDK